MKTAGFGNYAPWGLLLLLTACCPDGDSCKFSDSSSQDSYLGSPSGVGADSSAQFIAANGVFKRNCTQCHGSFSAYTEAQWISENYVVAGEPSQSTIFQRIRGSRTGGAENMPPGLSISSGDVQIVQDWITQMHAAPPSGNGPPGAGSTAATRLAAALTVFARVSSATGRSCNTCHGVIETAVSVAYSGQQVPAFGAFVRDNDFVTGGLVVPGVASSSSWIYKALRTHGVIGTMPKSDASSISAADAAALDSWITQIGNP